MKRILLLFMAFLLLFLTACAGQSSAPFLASQDELLDFIPNSEWAEFLAEDYTTKDRTAEKWNAVHRRMIRHDGKLYMATGVRTDLPESNVSWTELRSSVESDREPVQNRQSNFGENYVYREVPGGLDVKPKDRSDTPPMRFVELDQEDDWGLTLTAMHVTPENCLLLITQYGGEEENVVKSDAYFRVEKWENEVWNPLPTAELWEMYAIHVPRGHVYLWKADWDYYTGSLEPGRYRVVKEFTIGDWNNKREYSAEFTIE